MEINKKSVLNDDFAERIAKLEKYSKIKFPLDYLGFIKEYNIAIPITNKFNFNGHDYIVERFLGFVNEYRTSELGNFDIAVVLSQIDSRLTDNPNLVGDEIIPIAFLFAGDYLCLDFRNSLNEPEICIWYHEESEEFKPVTKKVANSFVEFLYMLK